MLPVLVVYAAGLLQGLTLVSFPALSPVLIQVIGLTSAEYGAIFLPQVGMAVVGSFIGAALARRTGLKALLILAIVGNGASQALLAATPLVGPAPAYALILAGTAFLGLGFGLIGAPINSYPPLLFPGQRQAALVAVHTLVGLGLSAGPLIAGEFVVAARWPGFPLLLVALCALLAATTAITALPAEAAATGAGAAAARRPIAAPTFWLFVAITVLYAFAEGTFANWAAIYLKEAKGLPEMTASLALSVFWGALVAGRLLIAVLLTRVPATAIWMSLPILMIAAFLVLPHADGAVAGVGVFGLAGLACSAFFPLTIALASERFPGHVAWVSSMLIAALMVGVGVGSFAIGALREMLDFAQLYRLSALYPAVVLVLAVIVWRTPRRDISVALPLAEARQP